MSTLYYIGSDLQRTYYISHHGILGQKWGVRRYQNKNGTLTSAGKKRRSFSSLLEPKVTNVNGTKVTSYSWLQDKLGVDERDRAKFTKEFSERRRSDLTKAADNYVHAKAKKQRAENYLNDWFNKYTVHSPNNSNYSNNVWYDPDGVVYGPGGFLDQWHDELDDANDEFEKAKRSYYIWNGNYTASEKAAKEASAAYSKTPLGMLDSAKSTVSKGISYVKNLFKRKK